MTQTRRHDVREEDPLRIRYLPRLDENGNLYYEDLIQEIPTTKASASDVVIYLYTPSNPNTPAVIASNNAGALSSTNFDASLPIFVITHGWNNNYQSDVNANIKSAILSVTNANVFVVDWSSLANGLYTYAFSQVESVGNIAGNFLYSVTQNYNIGTSNIRLIGHSLGAHISGCIGASISSSSGSLVSSIVGLDPAGPLFSTGNTNNRLDTTDASFVHIIHTNGGLLGFSSAIGHADYYPNGGSSQNGCGIDLVGTCAHSRSHQYYAESISSTFSAHNCQSHSNYNNGNCYSNHQSTLGELYVDTS